MVSNLSGATASKIIDAMLAGEQDVKELVKLRHGRMQSTSKELAASLNGNLTAYHKFMLQTFKESIESKRVA